MELRISNEGSHSQKIEPIIVDAASEVDDVHIESPSEEFDERLFPGLEDPVIQKIVVVSSYHAAKEIYVRLKEGLDKFDAQVHLSAGDIEDLKWDLMESETGMTESDLTVTETHTPEEAGGVWFYEFIGREGNMHQLRISTDDLSFEHRVIE